MPAEHFTIFGTSMNQSYDVRKWKSMDFEAPKLWNDPSGCKHSKRTRAVILFFLFFNSEPVSTAGKINIKKALGQRKMGSAMYSKCVPIWRRVCFAFIHNGHIYILVNGRLRRHNSSVSSVSLCVLCDDKAALCIINYPFFCTRARQPLRII